MDTATRQPERFFCVQASLAWFSAVPRFTLVARNVAPVASTTATAPHVLEKLATTWQSSLLRAQKDRAFCLISSAVPPPEALPQAEFLGP